MTPEQRFTTIENLLAALTEAQVRNEAQIEAHSAAIEKQNAGIRDLLAVSRTLVDAQMKTTAHIDELRDAQKSTEDKLHALIETVDRLIRSRQK
jgi:chromosome segregation ATPase